MKALVIRIVAMTLFLSGVAFAQVSEQWVQRFTSDSTRDETVSDMFVDDQGNVYVTGSQRGPSQSQLEAVTVKYNALGIQQWIQNYHAPANGAHCRAIHVDAVGNVYVTGVSGINSPNEMLVIKYSPAGTQLWFRRYQYAASTANWGYDVITDLTGNVYVAGEYTGDANNVFLVKFDPNGNLVNQTAYHRASEGARRIGMDGAGKIIVSGYINDNDSLSYLVLKYEQNLDFVWAARWGRGVGNQNVIDMAIDINSNIIVTGTNSLTIDYATVKINPAGSIQWGKLYSSAFGWDKASGVVTDNVGNIYIAGEVGTAGLPFTYDFCTIKYSPNGDEQWIRMLKPTLPPGGYYMSDIALDNSSNIYVTGYSIVVGQPTAQDVITAKYNSAGSLQWTRSYTGPMNNSSDYGVAVGADGNGNTYATGNSNNNNSTTGNDITIIKYVPASIFTSDRKKNVVKDILDNQVILDTIAVDYTTPTDYRVLDVNVGIDTVLHPNVSDLEFTLIHNGIIDTLIYQVGGTGDNFIRTVLNDSAATSIASGTAPFTGSFRPSRPLTQFNNSNVNGNWILRVFDRTPGNTGMLRAWSLNFTLSATSTDVRSTTNLIPSNFVLEQNYPNPFNPSTTIQFALPKNGHVELKVYNTLGQEVATLLNAEKVAGTYSAQWNSGSNASGVYYCRLQAGGFIETKRMLLLK